MSCISHPANTDDEYCILKPAARGFPASPSKSVDVEKPSAAYESIDINAANVTAAAHAHEDLPTSDHDEYEHEDTKNQLATNAPFIS